MSGPKNYEELETLLKDDNRVKVAGIDVDGILRGKIMSKSKFLSLCKSNPAIFGFCGVVFGWDAHDMQYPNELTISNAANGFADIHARIDFDSFRRIPFENDIPFFFVTFLDPNTQELLFACPRATLERVLKQATDDFGMQAFAGAEYEYFQFKETPQSAADKGFANLSALTPGNHGYSLLRPLINNDYFHGIYDACLKFGIEIEGHHTETGPGVFETALAYTEAKRMADNATLFKLTAKAVGLQHGIIPTFMAKPYANQAGCSGHVHISLRKNGKNVFTAETPRKDARFKDLEYLSEECEYFLAGLLRDTYGQSQLTKILPAVNGYKRLVEGFWAPTNVSWGYESRLASVRVIGPPTSSAEATRLEIRMPGADMNPHYTFAAIIALGLWGMKEKMPLEIPPVSADNKILKNTDKDPSGPTSSPLPKDLKEAATRMLHKDSVARKVMGDKFVEHFGATRLHEWNLYNAAISQWEIERYLELA